jgi:hypothetical protein
MLALWTAAACAPDSAAKLTSLGLGPETEAALSRLRWATLHSGDRVEAGDLIVCGERDRAVLGFSKKLVVAYLGLDAEWLVPELFATVRPEEVLLAVGPKQLARIRLPRGIGTTGAHPLGFVREVTGYPVASGDARALALAFADEQELFAVRDEGKPPPGPAGVPTAPDQPRRLGVSVFPRMGPQVGVVIAEVEPRSPAERAGLVKGDRIIRVNGAAMRSFSDLKQAISSTASAEISIDFVRKGGKVEEHFTLRLD